MSRKKPNTGEQKSVVAHNKKYQNTEFGREFAEGEYKAAPGSKAWKNENK